jgi:hypothetical protein
MVQLWNLGALKKKENSSLSRNMNSTEHRRDYAEWFQIIVGVSVACNFQTICAVKGVHAEVV